MQHNPRRKHRRTTTWLRHVWFWSWCLAVALPAHPATAQEAPAPQSQPGTTAVVPAKPPSDPIAEIAARREALSPELAAAKRNLEAARATESQPPEALQKEADLLQQIDLVLAQQAAQLQHAAELRTTKQRVESDLGVLRTTGPTEERRDSFLFLDTLRSERDALEAGTEKIAAAKEAAQKTYDEAQKLFAEKERLRRQAKEAVATNTDQSAAPRLAVAHRLAELESRLAQETVALRDAERRNQTLEDQVHQARFLLLSEKIAWVAQRVTFTKEDLKEQLDKIEEERFDLEKRLRIRNLDLEAATRRLSNVRDRRDRSTEVSQVLTEEVEAVRLLREARVLDVTLIQNRLERLSTVRQIWQRRFDTFHGHVSDADLKTWHAETAATRDDLSLKRKLQTNELSQLRKTLVTLQEKLEAAKEQDTARWIREQARAVQDQIGLYEAALARLDGTVRLCNKLIAEIEPETATVTFGERIASLWNFVASAWGYELTSVDDRPITVSKIVIGLFLLIVGLVISRRLARWISKRVLGRFGVTEGAIAAIQSLLFYVLVLAFTLVSLHIVNVPLTAFTILGGALAIGIGFGSQNIMNNFISGLILLAERPIRVGDLIEIEGDVGTVERIGARSTMVKSPLNVDLILPNSAFLEKKVINWTLSDDRYCTNLSVGVAYGSPTREVARLIRRAIDEHGKIFSKPEPIVYFSDFGDNALTFTAYFWIRMRRMGDRRLVESDVRFRIDSLFREAGITISFPQRDVHLDTLRPLEVRVLPPADPDSAEKA